MSEQIDHTKSHGSGSASPAIAIASLALGVLGAIIGYRLNLLVGLALVIACIGCGIVALRRKTPLRWMAVIGIVLGVLCLVICAAVIGIFIYQTQQMNELLAYS